MRILAYDFRSIYFTLMYHVPGYTRWLLEDADIAPAYAWHKVFLNALTMDSRRWVLKCPAHLLWLDALLREYPNAVIIETHRDPRTVLRSAISLVSAMRQASTKSYQPSSVARDTYDWIIAGFERSVRSRIDGIIPGGQLLDIRYEELVEAPLRILSKIYSQLNVEFSDIDAERAEKYLEANPQHKFGRPTYQDLRELDLDLDEFNATTRPYVDAFLS